ncbi:YncE family protein [Pseudoalteromonas luteoviolacea]|nr:hypothetical protein [Pseudoalteromonas luteoviolacea]KZN43356.1 hypothetical protein N483_08665 [Pseudoalteromonas luteoviolacea NCIMB 1944]
MKKTDKYFSKFGVVLLSLATSFSVFANENTCLDGLFAIDRFSGDGHSAIYHIDTDAQVSREVPGATFASSNIAGLGEKLYTMQRIDSDTNASKLYEFDMQSMQQREIADTTSFPIKRSAVSPSGDYLLATSQTYMYQFDLITGEKTVLGKMKSDSATYDDFDHGDIAYSADGNFVYVLNAKALYVLDEATMTLNEIGEHNLHWASGLAVDENGTIYVSARNSGENAKIYTLDGQTAQATYVMDGPAHIADLTYVQGCGDTLPVIANALQKEIDKANLFWLANGNSNKVANLAGFKDGTFNFNDQGFPVESKDKLNKHNRFTKNPNANRCARMWNNFLEHQYTLNRNGKGRKKADGSTKWYFSTEAGEYKVIKASKGSCHYGYASGAPGKIIYNSKTGIVSVQ